MGRRGHLGKAAPGQPARFGGPAGYDGAQEGRENAWPPDDSALVELPVRAQYYNTGGYNTAGMALAGAGLEVTYRASDLYEDVADIGENLFIPYCELRPLVRPGTPLARMLRARGMW